MSLRERLNSSQGGPPFPNLPADQQAPSENGDVPADVDEQTSEPAPSEVRFAEKTALADRLRETAAAPSAPGGALRQEQRPPGGRHGDPFATLKTRIHRAVIDSLGAQLFGAAIDDDLTEV